jgi:hypothetical protein
LLAEELRDLLEESGGSWEGSATDLHRLLDEREVESLPSRPEELSKFVLRIGERSPILEIAHGWRKIGGRGGRSKRVLKLALVDPAKRPAKNAVDPVVTVDPISKGDNGNNDVVDPGNTSGDNGNNGNNGANGTAEDSPDPAPADATDTRSEDRPDPEGERSRFTI